MRLLILVVTGFWAIHPGGLWAAEEDLLNDPERVRVLLDSSELDPAQVPNPHWREEGCPACHQGGEEGAPALRTDDINRLCNSCHSTAAVGDYIHPVGMKAHSDFLSRMPPDFKEAITRGGNRVTCITCHDLPMQCDTSRRDEGNLNPRFFRGGPYQERTDLCFNCHNPKKYERYNPHDQINDQGELDLERCYVCHSVMPERSHAKGIHDVQFNLVDKLEQLCTGCHPWQPHPGGGWASFASGSTNGKGPNHLVVPTEEIRRNLEQHEKQNNIAMPLEPATGRVFCATCHNPHERGVQYLHRADKGADGVRRLRRGQHEICDACHDK
ncbi:hypothetical protein [Thiohalomonas denitrificans]|uniref:hypothetical protein n=1 Tax=Thiohalomonas denitrificans TaxID=415747 RepID=UPI0026F05959|nr:hypothetical protein [Thiohalomonas denitrificans]